MTDIVNQYFKKFYPPKELLDATEQRWDLGIGVSWPVEGYNTIFPAMQCNDGFWMSVQGHWGAYSQPRDDWAMEYWKVEIMISDENREPLLEEYMGDDFGDRLLYAYVPVWVVAEVVEKHGGLKE